MSIDKSLYQAPMGLQQEEHPLDIEIINPEMVTLDDGSVEISIAPDMERQSGDTVEFAANLADHISESELESIASDLIAEYVMDLGSRKEWEKTYTEGLKLLGLQYEERTEPWSGACGVFHPMLAEAVVRFQSETIMETFPASGPVKTIVVGKQTHEKEDAAKRVAADMNYQLTEVMTEYRPEHEKMLWNLPISGSAFKKVYYDPSLGRQVAMFIPAEDVVLPYGVSELSLSPRVTHRMRKTKNELTKLMEAGFYREVELGEPSNQTDDIQKAKDKETGFTANNDDRYMLLEMQVELDLPGFEHENADKQETGIALPYVVTLIKDTGTILAIRRNWYEDDLLHTKRQHFVHYQYIPGFGAYGFGLIHLIGGAAKSATSLTRQLVDAGTLSNLPGGLKTRGLRIKGDDTPIAPGEWRDVDITSGSLKESIVPLPYKEPSQTLLALMNQIVDDARKFAATADMKVSDMSANAPVGTTLAILERMLKVMSAVQARLHYSLKQELKLLAVIIADYTDPDYSYEPEEGKASAKKGDYDNVDVIPVSDPNASTMSQRVVQYQAVIQLADTAPQIYNLPQLHRQMLDVLGIKNAEKLIPLEDDLKPTDPVTENMNILMAKPVKAFIFQDHEAHIKVHMNAMQDPKIMQMMGQNPQAQSIMAAAHAHLSEHVAYAYRQALEQKLGVPLPSPEEPMPPQLEVQLASAMAEASQKLLGQNQAEAQAQAAQQAQQDPVLQQQNKELELKAKELELKATQQKIEAANNADRINVEREKIASQERIAEMNVTHKVTVDAAKLQLQHELEHKQMGMDLLSQGLQPSAPQPMGE